MIVSPEQHLVPLYRRSPAQVALLLFATSGLYIFWWAFYTRRWCAGTLERQDQPLWKSIALIIPIFNFFLLFDLGKMIEGVTFRAQLPAPRFNLGIVAIGAVIFGAVVTRLHYGFGALSFLTFIPITYLHWHTYRAETVISGEAATPAPFGVVEYVLMAIGLLYLGLACTGFAIQGHGVIMIAVLIVAAGVLVRLFRRERGPERASAG